MSSLLVDRSGRAARSRSPAARAPSPYAVVDATPYPLSNDPRRSYVAENFERLASWPSAQQPAEPLQDQRTVVNLQDFSSSNNYGHKPSKQDRYEEDLAYGNLPPPKNPASNSQPPVGFAYAQPRPWEYEKTDSRISYDAPNQDTLLSPTMSANPGRAPSPSGYNRASVVTVEPGMAPLRSAMRRDKSPQPPVGRMSMLTVQTPHHSAAMSLSSAPASPLLESYQGTWQSMPAMPSPLLMANPNGDLVEPLPPVLGDDDRKRRRARFHDPAEDAGRLATALKGERRAPDAAPLIEILPGLTHDEVMNLRVEYKRIVKTGSERKGVNVAKHIRARLKDEDPSLMKACYATALGRWESEAYWANFWYQGDKTRRELLIESLMGRSNLEIAMIKDGFADKKYDNSLERCMSRELKEDKFKKAVLMVLDERRMEDTDQFGRPLALDLDVIEEDVRELHRAVRSPKGGESAMLEIVVTRSDRHLREVLRVYREAYGSNFAKDALKKSGNLVGEVLAHILNGVINRPTRDAMLLYHALTASKKDELRRELLISRLVRYHWDSQHMALVKAAFRDTFGKDLQEAVKEGTRGEWGEFCQALCITRMPSDVRRM